MVVDTKVYYGIGGLAAVLGLLLLPQPHPCEEGAEECRGDELWRCENGEWILDNPIGCQIPICEDGATECRGDELWRCENGEWILDNPIGCQIQCNFQNLGATKCAGDNNCDLYTCVHIFPFQYIWQLTEENSVQCGINCGNGGVIKGDIYAINAPDTATVGIPITAIVHYKNTSDVSIIAAVQLTVDGQSETSSDTIVAPQGTHSEEFTITFTSPGDYLITAQLLGEAA